MLMLASNPKAQERLFKEVSDVLQGRDPTYEDFSKLKFAYSTFKETLRMHSPVKATVKTNIEKCTLNGIEFPKNSQFQLYLQAVHFDVKLWENPTEFKPERFLENPNPAYFVPFAYGKRNCIGSKFAEVEGTIVLAMLIQKFSIHLKEGIDISKYEDEVVFVTALQRFDNPYILKRRK